jgi:hypothetical protein
VVLRVHGDVLSFLPPRSMGPGAFFLLLGAAMDGPPAEKPMMSRTSREVAMIVMASGTDLLVFDVWFRVYCDEDMDGEMSLIEYVGIMCSSTT